MKKLLDVIEKNNPFLDLEKPTLEDMKKVLNHPVWIRLRDMDSVVEYVCKVLSVKEELISLEQLEQDRILTIKLENILGLLDLTQNLKNPMDFNKYISKIVKLTNDKNNSIPCMIQGCDNYLVYFAVRLKDRETLSFDLSYPINRIKKIELLEE
ncbi:MAG: hypothetical protein IJ772_01945 [Bacilli bacterium]|nr:hypothetical protein [Bacilli bacterium]